MLRRLYEIAKSVLSTEKESEKESQARSFRFESLEEKQMLTKFIDFDPTTNFVTIQGDAGNDTALVYDQGTRVVIELDGFGQRNYARNQVKRIEFYGGPGNDTFKSTSEEIVYAFGNDGDDSLTGGINNDRLNGGDGIDRLFGNLGNDILIGGNGDDQLNGGDGNDRLLGGPGNDRGNGQGGNDRVFGGSGNDILRGDGGDDFLAGNGGDDELYGDNGEDLLHGQAGHDIMHGGFDNDRLFGGNGDDELHGDAGEDRLNGNAGNDVVRGGSEDDYVQLGPGNDTGYGDHGNDKVVGFDGNDLIFGGPGRDFLIGNAGSDEIFGEGGADILRGVNGNDILHGGDGPDVLRGDGGDDSLYGGAGLDKIWGGGGMDGLFGGVDNVRDRLFGQTDEDRFLQFGKDIIGDRFDNNEAIVMFENSNDSWTDKQVEVVDTAFRHFHFRLQNTDLLEDTIADDPIVFVKTKSISGGDDGRNDLVISRERYFSQKNLRWEERVFYERKIIIADWDDTNDALNTARTATTINLMAKNWDSITELTKVDGESQQRWADFLISSNWTDQFPNDPLNYTISGDSLWWYTNDSSFEANGNLNPSEDWSTIWVKYFMDSRTSADPEIDNKLDQVDSLMVSMTQK